MVGETGRHRKDEIVRPKWLHSAFILLGIWSPEGLKQERKVMRFTR